MVVVGPVFCCCRRRMVVRKGVVIVVIVVAIIVSSCDFTYLLVVSGFGGVAVLFHFVSVARSKASKKIIIWNLIWPLFQILIKFGIGIRFRIGVWNKNYLKNEFSGFSGISADLTITIPGTASFLFIFRSNNLQFLNYTVSDFFVARGTD